ncbi:response regulator transcription factor [Sphingomonas sp. AR_OL41]|nr:response regulator transcription factor [Sphingomonas sp. AR_OL41]
MDDDGDVVAFVRAALIEVGYHCEGFATAAALLAALRRDTFDLLLLDWNLPDRPGIEILRTVRATMSPAIGVIMLTSRADKLDITAALGSGADDYVVKPESAAVIAARVAAVLRRTAPTPQPVRTVRFGDHAFDRLTASVAVAGIDIALSAKEFQLALTFFENLHRPMSRGYLLESVWQSDATLPTRTLDMHVSRIRTKLKLVPENGFRIVAISGYGYRLEQFDPGECA